MRMLIIFIVVVLLCGIGNLFSQSGPRTKIRLFKQTTAFDSIVTRGDTLIFHNQDSTHKALLSDLDSTNEILDTIYRLGDSIAFVEGDDTIYTSAINDHDWYKIGTTSASLNISDSIYTGGDVQLLDYPNTRADDTSAYLNVIFSDINGNLKSGRREIIPPSVDFDVSATSTGNTFNYYNHYATQTTNMGVSPIAIANLDFYIAYFDNLVFSNVSINALGVLSYDIISISPSTRTIDIRFYTK